MSNKVVIGLVAVRDEAAPLLNRLKVKTTTRRLQARIHHGILANQAVVLAEVGPGKIQAAVATQSLIERYQARLVLSCGSAGAIDPKLNVGDIVLANRVVPHDTGQHLNRGFEYLGIYDNSHPTGLHYHHHLAVHQALQSRLAAWPAEIKSLLPIQKSAGSGRSFRLWLSIWSLAQ